MTIINMISKTGNITFILLLKCTINFRIKQGNPRLIAGNCQRIGLNGQSITNAVKQKTIKVLEVIGSAIDDATTLQADTCLELDA